MILFICPFAINFLPVKSVRTQAQPKLPLEAFVRMKRIKSKLFTTRPDTRPSVPASFHCLHGVPRTPTGLR